MTFYSIKHFLSNGNIVEFNGEIESSGSYAIGLAIGESGCRFERIGKHCFTDRTEAEIAAIKRIDNKLNAASQRIVRLKQLRNAMNGQTGLIGKPPTKEGA